MWRQAQLTDAIRPGGAAVVGNYYVAHLACCLMQCNLVLQASARLARDKTNQCQSQMRKAHVERPFSIYVYILPASFACLPAATRWPLFSPPACRQPRGTLPGWGRPFLLLDWPALEPQSTRHEHVAAHRETEAVAEDGRCCMCALRVLCIYVITEQLRDR
jgi:hypothetical protein